MEWNCSHFLQIFHLQTIFFLVNTSLTVSESCWRKHSSIWTREHLSAGIITHQWHYGYGKIYSQFLQAKCDFSIYSYLTVIKLFRFQAQIGVHHFIRVWKQENQYIPHKLWITPKCQLIAITIHSTSNYKKSVNEAFTINTCFVYGLKISKVVIVLTVIAHSNKSNWIKSAHYLF